MILVLDNYDSFTFNLVQAIGTQGVTVEVHRNDALDPDEVLARDPAGLILSPGPGRPQGAGITPELLRRAPAELPVLGICLGHQALVEHYGGTLERDPRPVHGRPSLVHHDGSELFRGLPNPFLAGRYHSLRAQRDALPAELRLTAWTDDGLVMGVRHAERPHFGLQFHPESILTPQGNRLLEGFVALTGLAAVER